VLLWLQAEPDVTAKMLFQRLQDQFPGRYDNGQLRTLQRRIRQWRHVMARQLVFSSADEGTTAGAIAAIGTS
jgi:hypothetical protein